MIRDFIEVTLLKNDEDMERYDKNCITIVSLLKLAILEVTRQVRNRKIEITLHLF